MARPSPALIVSCVALAVAIGGTGYAVTALPRNSVGTAQLKKNAVTSAKVKDGTLLASDFKPGQLAAAGPGATSGPAGPSGPSGPVGPTGPQGAAGSARAYGRIAKGGTLIAEDSSGIASVTRLSSGMYCVTPRDGIDVTTSVPIVSVDWSQSSTDFGPGAPGGQIAVAEATPPMYLTVCPATAFSVYTYNFSGTTSQVTKADQGFFIMVP